MTNTLSFGESEFRGDHGELNERIVNADEFTRHVRMILTKENFIDETVSDLEMMREAGRRIGLRNATVESIVVPPIGLGRDFVVDGMRKILAQGGADMRKGDTMDDLLIKFENLLDREDTITEETDKKTPPREEAES